VTGSGFQTNCEFEAEIDQEAVQVFSRLSGDWNPLHNDSDYAAGTEFGRPIAHGSLLVGLVSRVLGMYVPGKQSLILSMRVQFPKPLFYPGRVKVVGRLKNFNERKNRGVVGVTITDLGKLWDVLEADVAFSLHALSGEAPNPPEKTPLEGADSKLRPTGERARLLVTGGTGGIGAAVLPMLLEHFDVTCITRVPGRKSELAGLRYAVVDLEEDGEVERFLDETPPDEFFGVLHMSVAPVPRAFVSDDLDVLRRHLRQSVEIPALLAQWARTPKSSIKRLILIGSTAGSKYPKPHFGAYSLGKAAMEQLVRLLVGDLSALGATVNMVAPTVVPVGLNEGMPERSKKALVGRMPTGKLVGCADVASTVLFLLSDAAAQINGASIAVDGGLTD
jgi:L-xylulose reductase